MINAKRRKGQFLTVSAVMIIIILYMLSSTISRSRGVETSNVQDNNPVWILENTEKSLYKITMKNLTSPADI